MKRLRIKAISGYWHLTGTYLGQRVRRSTRFPADQQHLPQAEQARERCERAILGSQAGQIALARGARPLADRCLADAVADYVRGQSGASHGGRGVLRKFLADFGPRPVRTIKTVEVQSWVVREFALPGCEGWRVKGSTLRTELGPLRRLFKQEYEMGHVERTLRLILPPVGPGRDVFLTTEQARQVIATEPPPVAPLFTFLLYTGARFQEAIRLTWEDIRLTEAWVILTHRKGSKGLPRKRRVPLAPEIVSRLAQLPHREGNVFLNTHGREHPHRTGIQAVWHHWRKQREALGLTHVRIHDFRHTFASNLVMQGVELRKVADLLGHTKLDQTRKYAHLAPTTLTEAVAKLHY